MSYEVPGTFDQDTLDNSIIATNKYIGPDFIWVDIIKEGKDAGKWNKGYPKTNYDDGDNEGKDFNDQSSEIEALPVPLDCNRIKVDCSVDPMICSMFLGPKVVDTDFDDPAQPDGYENIPTEAQTLADGEVFFDGWVQNRIPPLKVFDMLNISYSEENGWVTPLRKNTGTWEEIRSKRNHNLENTDSKGNLPEGSIKTAWDKYRQELRDMPEKYADVNPSFIPFPESPEIS